jgi:hypothetical protein
MECGIMADENTTPPDGENNILIEARRLIFEVRIILESVAAGLEALQALPEAILIKEQLGVLRKLTSQAAEVLETFSEVITPRPAD